MKVPKGILVCLLAASFASAQPPDSGLKIVVLDGEDSVNIIDKKTAVAPIVEVRDKNDLPVAGAIVTFTIIGIGGSAALFGNGQREVTVMTNASGRATASSVQPLSKGAFKIDVTANYQGQIARTSVTQTNYATAADAAKDGKTPGEPDQANSGSGNSNGSGGGNGSGNSVAAASTSGGGTAVTSTATAAGGAAGGGGMGVGAIVGIGAAVAGGV